MALELSFCLINPYTIGKSRTGGVIGRIMTRTGLELVAARMYGPSPELVQQYADLIRNSSDISPDERKVLADYVSQAFAPDPKTGHRRRVMLLLFEGEDAIAKVREAVGSLRPHAYSGETVRDTYGDYIVDDQGKVAYVEPAVMMARSRETVAATLKLWSSYAQTDGGLVAQAHDVSKDGDVQQTLVIIKPDNFTFPSSRPGNIIDIFSRSGLRIVAAKVNRMTVAQAEEFYGPVRNVLREKMKSVMAKRGGDALEREMGFHIPENVRGAVGEQLGPVFGDIQFHQIVEFMTGVSPIGLTSEQKTQPGRHKSLVLIYSGVNAVEKIRKILGPTDPSKAEPGSVRKEFGRDIMVNAAHASDSAENAQREMGIVKPEEDWISWYTEKYFA
ncbi:MAG TPA: nucleoside-diphosphate kinase [Kiritimatiellia bacterium]|nr:nucleoside-diphosphate kinase [Kiritimatiellia bacterium]